MTKPKFRVGQVVADCVVFNDTKGAERVRGYVLVRPGDEKWMDTEITKQTFCIRYFRPLTARERGPQQKKGK